MILHLLFDLDGTLIDSREGVIRSLQHAVTELGRPAPAFEDLTRYIGPPLASSLAQLLGTSDTVLIERGVAAYRAQFERAGMFENVLYPGIREALANLTAAGCKLCVVTAKPRVYAAQIVKHLEVASFFGGIYGPDMAQRHYTKEALIREACVAERIEAARAMMIGDRTEDILGARKNGLRSMAVTWGYEAREELDAAHPDYVATSSEELVEKIQQANDVS